MDDRTARAFGILGLIVFGLLILVGAIIGAWELAGTGAILAALLWYDMRK